MKKSSVIISTLLILIILEVRLSAGRGKPDSEEWFFLSFTKKFLTCCLRKKVFDEEESEEPIIRNNSLSFKSIFFEKSEIENLDIELLRNIFQYLSPEDINFLSISSKSLKMKVDNEFWEKYILDNKKERWNRSTSAVKVACAYSFFDQGRVEKAAKLRLPIAVRILNHRKWQNEVETENRKNKILIYKTSYSDTNFFEQKLKKGLVF